METESPRTPEHSDSVTIRPGSFGRGRQNITKENHSEPGSPLDTPAKKPEGNLGPLTLCTNRMTDTEIHQAIRDTRNADQELLLKDENGKVPVNYNTNLEDNPELSDLELASNLSSSTEIEAEIITEEKRNLRRSKRLTKTNPILRYNNPICHDYRKHREKAEIGQHTGSIKHRSGEQQPDIDRQPDKIQTLRQHTNCDKIRGMDRVTVHKPAD